MKKLLILLLICILALFSVSCNGGDTVETTGGGTTDSAPSVSDTADTTVAETVEDTAAHFQTGLEVSIDGIAIIPLGAAADSVIPALGEPQTKQEAPSCVHEGTDTLYTYAGYTVTTSPNVNGGVYVDNISIISDEASILGGLTIGSDMDMVLSSFGSEYTDNFGALTFELDGASATVVMTDGLVSSLTVKYAK